MVSNADEKDQVVDTHCIEEATDNPHPNGRSSGGHWSNHPPLVCLGVIHLSTVQARRPIKPTNLKTHTSRPFMTPV